MGKSTSLLYESIGAQVVAAPTCPLSILPFEIRQSLPDAAFGLSTRFNEKTNPERSRRNVKCGETSFDFAQDKRAKDIALLQ
jgi:hypothetical protein